MSDVSAAEHRDSGAVDWGPWGLQGPLVDSGGRRRIAPSSLKKNLNIKNQLKEIGLAKDNAVVIGSGILNALNLRKSNDVDVVVTDEKYKIISTNSRFKKTENHGREMLTDGLFEIGPNWTIVGRVWKFEDLMPYSTVVDGVRYNNIEFLMRAKQAWLASGDVRQKDIDDIKLMENYLSHLPDSLPGKVAQNSKDLTKSAL